MSDTKKRLDDINRKEKVPRLDVVDGIARINPDNPLHQKWFEEFKKNDDDILPVKDRLRQALAEMKLIREGKLPSSTWPETKEESKEEQYEDDYQPDFVELMKHKIKFYEDYE